MLLLQLELLQLLLEGLAEGAPPLFASKNGKSEIFFKFLYYHPRVIIWNTNINSYIKI